MTSVRLDRRRLLAHGLAAAGTAALPVLAGCSGGQRNSDRLSFWQFYGPGGPSPDESAWAVELVEQWNANHDTKVELQYVPSGEYSTGNKLQVAFASGEGPDIFILSSVRFLEFLEPGALQDLTPHLDPGVLQDFYPGARATRSMDGRLYALPMETEPVGLYYNVPVLERAGLSEGDLPTTWEQLLATAEKARSGDTYGMLLETREDGHQAFSFYPWMWMAGGDIVADDGRHSRFAEPETVTAMRFWQELIRRDVAPRTVLGDGSSDLVANLGAEFCAFQEAGPWGIPALDRELPDLDYGVIPLPAPAGGETRTTGGGWSLVANAHGRDPETAARFCAFAAGSNDSACLKRLAEWARIAAVVPPRRSVMQRVRRTEQFDTPPMSVFVDDIFPTMRDTPRYPPDVVEPVVNALQSSVLAGEDCAQAAAHADEAIDSFLEHYDGARII